VKFPVTIRHRTSKAKIYAPGGKFAYYRLAYSTAGKRRIQTFAAYSAAKTAAERIVRELADGSQAAALNASQSRDALAALQRLESFRQVTGRRFSLLAAVSEFVETVDKLKGRSLGEAVEGFLQTVVSVRRKDVSEAVEQFLGERKHKAEAKDGKRSQLSASYETHVAGWLRGFASTFPSTAVCDLTKEHINLYFNPLSEMSAKNRNDRRATVRMFLTWAVRQDYLPVNHRLFEASGMTRETVETADTDFFRPDELIRLLDNAPADLRPALAIAGLAGLRGEEIMRLDWADVWRVEGHIEITARQAKTRQRRLVVICPALTAWLESCRKTTGKVYPAGVHVFQRGFVALRDELGIPARRNGLRHAFCTYHFAAHSNENQTAQQAGNSPAMIHAHYKGLATKADAEKWFNVIPPGTAKNVIALSTSTRKKTS
jgi:integrase